MSNINRDCVLSTDRIVETRRADGSLSVEHFFDFPSKTDQSFKQDCDINLMVKRFTKANRMNPTQFLNYMATISPRFTSDGFIDGTPPELQVHLDNAIRADEMFMSLPADMRARFENSAVQFLDFVFKPENRAELASMGLLTPEAVERLKVDSKAANAVVTPSVAGSSSPAKGSSDQTST